MLPLANYFMNTNSLRPLCDLTRCVIKYGLFGRFLLIPCIGVKFCNQVLSTMIQIHHIAPWWCSWGAWICKLFMHDCHCIVICKTNVYNWHVTSKKSLDMTMCFLTLKQTLDAWKTHITSNTTPKDGFEFLSIYNYQYFGSQYITCIKCDQ